MDNVDVESSLRRIAAASSLHIIPFTMRLSNNIVDAASRGDDIIAIASMLSSIFSSLDATNISKTSVEQVLLPPKMEQALSAAWCVRIEIWLEMNRIIGKYR
jgi:hypothetical protein